MSDKKYNIGLSSKDRVAMNFGGGLPRGSLVLIEGEDGAGKSVLCQRFIKGFCTEEYNVSYFTPELTAGGFLEQMRSLSYPVIDDLITHKRLKFYNVDVNTREVLRKDLNIPDRTLLPELVNAENNSIWESDIIIIDSLDIILNNDPFFDKIREEGNEKIATQNFLDFIDELNKQDKTVILTADQMTIEGVLDPIRHKADVYMSIETATLGGEIRRNVHMKRFAMQQAQVDDIISFSVDTGNGIQIETEQVI